MKTIKRQDLYKDIAKDLILHDDPKSFVIWELSDDTFSYQINPSYDSSSISPVNCEAFWDSDIHTDLFGVLSELCIACRFYGVPYPSVLN